MKTFKYPFIAQIVYRYGNIPLSLILLFYLVISIMSITESWFSVVSVIVHLGLLIILNRFYIRGYRYFPYKIEADNEKMICSDFFMRNKKITIKFSDVESIKGGIFSNSPSKPVYITTKTGNRIGINQHLKGYNELITIILSNINKELYNELLEKIKSYGDKRKKK